MIGRVAASIVLVLGCGIGLHVDEVLRIGGQTAITRFKQVMISSRGDESLFLFRF